MQHHDTVTPDRPSDTALPAAGERVWLLVMAASTTVELIWWGLCWGVGAAPVPHLFKSLAFAFAALGAALIFRAATRRSVGDVSPALLVCTTVLVGTAASLFLPLKVAIPELIPFWLDRPLASLERTLFSADPWIALNRLLGWAMVPIDRLYSLWLPMQSVALFMVVLAAPSAAKSRALIAYSLAWLMLGVVAALLLSSAGPLFYDRLFGGAEFASLRHSLAEGGAWAALTSSDAMWQSLRSQDPGLVAGVSAVPSMHVAISFWMYLAARSMAPRLAPLALAYVLFIWAASVMLGWHYVADGLVGIAGVLAIWRVAPALERVLARGFVRPAGSDDRGRAAPGWFRTRYLDVLGSVYVYNEHRGYTAIDRMLEAVRLRWPDDREFIAQIEKHRADERKHYLMFRRWFEQRGMMPLNVDRTFGHIDRFVQIMFGSTIDRLDPLRILERDELFERLCRVVSLTEQRGYRQVRALLRNPIVSSDHRLVKIFHIIEQDEPSHWAPYERWLTANGRRQPRWRERLTDSFIHSELMLVKLPILFFALRMGRRQHWPDEAEGQPAALEGPALAART